MGASPASRTRFKSTLRKNRFIHLASEGGSFKPARSHSGLLSATKGGAIPRRFGGPRVTRDIGFHPQFHEAEEGSYRPTNFADPANTFHEKAILCRAAENTCYVATVNYASAGSPTTSAVVRPDGTLLCYQPYGQEGLLIADIDTTAATGLLASRYKPI